MQDMDKDCQRKKQSRRAKYTRTQMQDVHNDGPSAAVSQSQKQKTGGDNYEEPLT